uniref:Uncharacterized protein n=1 Tax=Arundo donax TaxID=35708 RepID=A0A0A9FBT3_ARUDO
MSAMRVGFSVLLPDNMFKLLGNTSSML